MEELFRILPLHLTQPCGHNAYLTLSTWEDGWQAAYVAMCDGFALPGYNVLGRSPIEALMKLQEQINLRNMLNAPAGPAEGVVTEQ